MKTLSAFLAFILLLTSIAFAERAKKDRDETEFEPIDAIATRHRTPY